MAKQVDNVVIRQIEAQKKAVMEAAQAFRDLRVANDPDWPNSKKGKNFDKSMELSTPDNLKEATKKTRSEVRRSGYEGKSMYGRAIERDYTGLRTNFTGLPRFLGGFSKEEKAIQQAQQKLLAAQNKLHETMDTNFGTNVGGMANEDRSLMEAVEGFTEKRGMLFGDPKSVVGTKDSLLTDMGKPFTSGASDIGSIFLGSGRSLTTIPGPLGIPLPFVERGNLPKKAFFTPKFLHKRKGVVGIIGNVAEIFTTMALAESPGELLGLAMRASGIAAVKITGNVLGMVFDAVKLAARAPELAIRATRFVGNVAFAAVKGGALVAYKGLFLNKSIFAQTKPTADFSLEAHGASPADVAAATAEHAEVNAAIYQDQAAMDAALAAANMASANGGTQEQNATAAREAGQKSLETSDKAIQDDPAAKKAAAKAEKKVLNKKGSPEEAKLAARKAGQAVLGKKSADQALKAAKQEMAGQSELTELESVNQEIAVKRAELASLEAGHELKPDKDFTGKQALLEQDLNVLLTDQQRLLQQESQQLEDFPDDSSEMSEEDYTGGSFDNDALEQSFEEQELLTPELLAQDFVEHAQLQAELDERVNPNADFTQEQAELDRLYAGLLQEQETLEQQQQWRPPPRTQPEVEQTPAPEVEHQHQQQERTPPPVAQQRQQQRSIPTTPPSTPKASSGKGYSAGDVAKATAAVIPLAILGIGAILFTPITDGASLTMWCAAANALTGLGSGVSATAGNKGPAQKNVDIPMTSPPSPTPTARTSVESSISSASGYEQLATNEKNASLGVSETSDNSLDSDDEESVRLK
ncbi:MAG: hypothetical protein P1U36_06380 [Legionellaceae bacterium]|nr:hypothetical protein [Legionellaceae bacterium]